MTWGQLLLHYYIAKYWNFICIQLLSNSINFRISEGKIINAATSDLVALDHSHMFINVMVVMPFASLAILPIVYSLVGIDGIWGFLIIFSFIIIQVFASRCIAKVRRRTSQVTDSRLKLLYDFVSGVRTIKAYGWELSLNVIFKLFRKKLMHWEKNNSSFWSY